MRLCSCPTKLTGAVVTNYVIEAAEEGHPTETLTLDFTKVTQTFNPRDAKLTGSPTTVAYDVKAAKTS